LRFGAGTALIVVDVQNDFADPRGSLYVAGGEEVVVALGAIVPAAGASGAPVVYTQDWHPPDTPHFAKDGGTWPVHCVAGTWGAELVRDLEVSGPVVRKGTGGEDGYSGFTVRDPVSGADNATGLESLLRDQGVQRLVVAGLATDYCVKETVLDGLRLGFGVTVLTGLVRAVDLEAGAGDRALAAMEDAGARLER
jgi:nicotinamidase/pyrazinamidase